MWSTANRIIHDKNRLDEARSKLFMVLDDLGREGDLPTRQADVSDIVSARYDAKLPTVIMNTAAHESHRSGAREPRVRFRVSHPLGKIEPRSRLKMSHRSGQFEPSSRRKLSHVHGPRAT
jgi:hypothetical protein